MTSTQQLQPFMLAIFLTFLLTSETYVFGQYANFNKLELPSGVHGAGAAAFGGLLQGGPYTTTDDGRIMKWQGPTIGFVDFAYTSPSRTKQLCDGTNDPDLWPVCGRPFGLSFNPLTGDLYIADLYFGLLVVGPLGGLATQLAGGYKFLNGIDVDVLTGHVYFNDASLTFTYRDVFKPGFVADSTGRLLRYDPLTGHVSVLLTGLSGGGGPAVSSDGTFVLIPEFTSDTILKYWLVGPKANTAEVLLHIDGNPSRIKRAERLGEFWVAESIGMYPSTTSPIIPEGVKINSDGNVLQTVSFAAQFPNAGIDAVQEHDGKLYAGSNFADFIGVYSN